jgi:poly(A) polymerase
LTAKAFDNGALESRLRRRVSRDRLLSGLRNAAESVGAELYLVGGYVRDAAFGRVTADIDLVAGHGCAALVRTLRSRWKTRGHRFRKRGVTTWRLRAPGHHLVDLVDASRRGLERDLLRRELTINAIAFDLREGVLFDPLRGCVDLRAGRLRPPSENAFQGDPLRALRLCRFMAQLPEFRPTAATRRSAAAVAMRLRRAPVERVRQELDKLLLGRDPRRGLTALNELGLRRAVLPELEATERCVAGRGGPDVWTHTIDAIEPGVRSPRLPGARAVRAEADRLVLFWALLLHDISKPETLATADDGRPTFHGHEVLGERRSDALLRRLRSPAAQRRRVCRLVRQHLRPGHLADAGAPSRGLRRLVRDAQDDLPLLVLHAACDARASGSPDAVSRWRRLGRVLRSLLALQAQTRRLPLPRLIDGRDVMRVLGLPPGPRVGRLLDRVRHGQEEGAISTRRQALALLRRLRD